MKTIKLRSFVLCLIWVFSLGSSVFSQEWNLFRGPASSGVLDGADLPATFNGATGENVLWKTPIPGLGQSSPVIWGNKLFVSTAVSMEDDAGFKPGLYGDITPVADTSVHEWKVYCLDTESGEILWEKVSYTGVPQQKRHPMSTHASATMATDGEVAVAFFGSEGLYCYDMEGELLWKKDFGLLRSVFYMMEAAEWEWASSPIIYDGVVLIQVDVMDQSFVAAYSTQDGKELWKTDRIEDPTWCTPNVYKVNGKTRVALNGYKERAGYDFKTGKKVWTMDGGGDIPIPVPQVSKDFIYFNSSHGKLAPIYAIKTTAEGDITLKGDEESNEHIAWMHKREGAYMASMLLYNDLLYVGKWGGSFACFDAKTGERYWKETLARGKSFVGSPIASDGKIYFTMDEGSIFVIEAGKEYKKPKQMPIGEMCMVTPALSKGKMFIRTVSGVMAVGE